MQISLSRQPDFAIVLADDLAYFLADADMKRLFRDSSITSRIACSVFLVGTVRICRGRVKQDSGHRRFAFQIGVDTLTDAGRVVAAFEIYSLVAKGKLRSNRNTGKLLIEEDSLVELMEGKPRGPPVPEEPPPPVRPRGRPKKKETIELW